MSQVTINIHWYGPFTEEDIPQLDEGNGLYMLTGKRRYQRSDSEIQYFGITETSYRTRFRNHKALKEINRELNIWLGQVAYPADHVREHLATAEGILIYFWKPELNTQMKFTCPTSPTTVVSHWYTADRRPRLRQQSIYKHLPDVICWDGAYWRTGNLSVHEAVA